MTEKQLDGAIRDLAQLYGFLRYHTYRATRSPAGFPDIVLVKPPAAAQHRAFCAGGWIPSDAIATSICERLARRPRVLFIELKAHAGCPGVERYLWRPDDLTRAAAILAGNKLAIALDHSSRTELDHHRRHSGERGTPIA